MAAKKKAAKDGSSPDRKSELLVIIAQEKARKTDGPENGPAHNEGRLKDAEDELATLT